MHIARALVKEGVNVSLAARSRAQLEIVRTDMAALGVKALATKCDVTNADDRARLLERTEAELGPVDILINNAGVETVAHFETTDEEDLVRRLDVNLVSAMLLTRAVLPGVLERKRVTWSSAQPDPSGDEVVRIHPHVRAGHQDRQPRLADVDWQTSTADSTGKPRLANVSVASKPCR